MLPAMWSTTDAMGPPSPPGHACWVYGSEAERRAFHEGALAFLAEGRARGERLVVVSDSRLDVGPADLAPLGDVTAMTERGELVMHDLADLSAGGGPVALERQVAVLRRSADAARAAGWSGVRLVYEASSQVVDPNWCDGHLTWEQRVGQLVLDQPLVMMCAYDERAVGPEVADALASVHPRRSGRAATFGVYPCVGGLALEGEVDACQVRLLENALATLPPDGPVTLDAAGATFFDAGATGVLARFAARRAERGSEVRVRSASPALARLWELFGFTETRAVRFL